MRHTEMRNQDIWGQKYRNHICLVLVISLFLTGCGIVQTSGSLDGAGNENTTITLHDPAEQEDSWESVAYRNLYDAQVFSATVFPEVEEYYFDIDIVLDQFNAYLGKTVRKGDILAYAERENLEASIEKMEEQIQSMEEEFQKYKENIEESLYESEAEENRLKDIVDAYVEAEPKEYDPNKIQDILSSLGNASGSETGESVSGDDAEDMEIYRQWLESYRKWEADYTYFEGNYRILAHQNDMTRQQLLQRSAIYEIDHDYKLNQLAKLQSQRKLHILTASAGGEIVAMQALQNGNRIPREQVVIAVGHPSHKLLKCEYINPSTIGNAESVFAIIDGVRFEVDYQPIDSKEYSRLSSAGESIYSTFKLADGDDEISLGTYAVIVVVQESRDQALTVPVDAIHRDGMGSFVYCREGDETIAVPITTGMSDGVYTEVTSGLEAGDDVLITDPITAGRERITLEKGSFSSHFKATGYFYYPRTYQVVNPVSNGTTYFLEYQVELYQRVKSGDVIATVRVQGDEVALSRSETKLRRLQERLAELIGEDEEKNKETIEQGRSEIADVEEEIALMKQDFATVSIVADHDGIVVQRNSYKEEDIIQKGSVVVVIADEETCYVSVENSKQQLHYGNEVTVFYNNQEGKQCEVVGKVANLSEAGTSSMLQSDHSYILVPPEAASDMAVVSSRNVNGWNLRISFSVETVVNEMEDVVLVPRSAVQLWEGQTYVVYVSESGELVAQSFIAGGYDAIYYWAVEGLTEGMVICSG